MNSAAPISAGGRWRMLHPATLFLLLTLVVVFLSWISDVYGLSAIQPDTGREIRVQSLLSPEGLRWWLRHVITNFTGFTPLGMVIVAMFGIGVARHSGFLGACIRRLNRRAVRPGRMVASVALAGLLSSVAGDAGYVLLLPIAAILFLSVGLHPVAGIVTAYVSVSCGYSANLFVSTLDPLLAAITREAADATDVSSGPLGPLCNYYFLAVSVLLLWFLISRITCRSLLPALGSYHGVSAFTGHKPLSHKERRALLMAWVVGALYAALVMWATFSPWGILRGLDGSLLRSPFMAAILFLLSFGIGLMGMVYGFVSGRYRTDADVADGLTQPMQQLGGYFVMVFFASQLFACLEYSRLDRCVAILGADFVSTIHWGTLGTLAVFILFTAVVNLFMVSATSKWAFMSFIFVPVLAGMGISPEVAQCAFRIGDSSTNALTPFMFYMPLVLTYMQQYDCRSTYVTLLGYTWRYSVAILLAYTALFLLWYVSGLPLGL
ncbi:AbgT family transporter [uncultured Bacteroides sp.]|uniref:AbgT family transporter n=1 Tax=uncultured Bacteroides sp. TaxID=162156 RepID=UPI002632AC00|nr:AbgT family transporter [uncultured Bacteroides sp.]